MINFGGSGSGGRIETGTYTGDGTATRIISLSFGPKYVQIFGFPISTGTITYCYKLEGKSIVVRIGGYATENTTHFITTNGFLVGTDDKRSDDSDNNTNRNDRIYYYVAIG